jgi:hypothetical protein
MSMPDGTPSANMTIAFTVQTSGNTYFKLFSIPELILTCPSLNAMTLIPIMFKRPPLLYATTPVSLRFELPIQILRKDYLHEDEDIFSIEAIIKVPKITAEHDSKCNDDVRKLAAERDVALQLIDILKDGINRTNAEILKLNADEASSKRQKTAATSDKPADVPPPYPDLSK